MKNKLFWVILIIAFVLRFYKLGEIPKGIDWDEASNAYNAYSILKTVRDEYGNFLPLTNRSFDDYKPPLYMYLNVPTVALFGLTPFAARLPSAFFGVLTVALIYFLAKKVFEATKNQFSFFNFHFSIADLSAFMLAISPWHLQFSRVGFEANVGLFFVVASFTSLLYAFSSKSRILLITSAILFGLSFYSYHAVRIFAPLLFLITLIIFQSEFIKIPKKYLIVFAVIVAGIILPFFIFTPKEALSQRFETTTQKSRIADIDESVKFILQDQDANIPFSNIIHNRRIVIARTTFANYLTHFDLNFLFTRGDDNFRHHIENMGMLYRFQLPLLIFGIFKVIEKKSRGHLFILSWLLLSPIPASFGDAVPHAVRSLSMAIPFSLISTYGLITAYKAFNFKKVFISFWIIVIGISLTVYLHNYYGHYAKDYAGWWQYGYLEAADETVKLQKDYQKIIVDRSIEQAYIYWLFATKFDPRIYQNSPSRDQFDKFVFAQVPENRNNLYVSTSLPQEFEVVKIIYDPNGKEVIKLGHPK